MGGRISNLTLAVPGAAQGFQTGLDVVDRLRQQEQADLQLEQLIGKADLAKRLAPLQEAATEQGLRQQISAGLIRPDFAESIGLPRPIGFQEITAGLRTKALSEAENQIITDDDIDLITTQSFKNLQPLADRITEQGITGEERSFRMDELAQALPFEQQRLSEELFGEDIGNRAEELFDEEIEKRFGSKEIFESLRQSAESPLLTGGEQKLSATLAQAQLQASLAALRTGQKVGKEQRVDERKLEANVRNRANQIRSTIRSASSQRLGLATRSRQFKAAIGSQATGVINDMTRIGLDDEARIFRGELESQFPDISLPDILPQKVKPLPTRKTSTKTTQARPFDLLVTKLPGVSTPVANVVRLLTEGQVVTKALLKQNFKAQFPTLTDAEMKTLIEEIEAKTKTKLN